MANKQLLHKIMTFLSPCIKSRTPTSDCHVCFCLHTLNLSSTRSSRESRESRIYFFFEVCFDVHMLTRPQATQEHESPEGAAAKNYVMYADSEEEMLEWIKALTEEIKPMIGENRYANGFGGGKTGSSKGGGAKQKKGKGDTVAVDDKALNEVSTFLCQGLCRLATLNSLTCTPSFLSPPPPPLFLFSLTLISLFS